MTPEEQLDEWVKGNSIHNNDRTYNVVDDKGNVVSTEKMVGGECCPDFSCCEPSLGWPIELRLKFKNADDATRSSMLGMSLTALVNKYAPDKAVHIAGEQNNVH